LKEILGTFPDAVLGLHSTRLFSSLTRVLLIIDGSYNDSLAGSKLSVVAKGVRLAPHEGVADAWLEL
jgi:hypothetical protein